MSVLSASGYYPPRSAPTIVVMQLHPNESTLIREYLADRDVTCPRCGQNLRGLSSERCPQCGYDLHLVLAGSVRQTWPFFAGLFGLAVATTAMAALLISALLNENWARRSVIAVLGLTILWLWVRSWIQQSEEFEVLPDFRKYERVALCWLWAALAVFLTLVL